MKTFGGVPALKGVALELVEGSVHALLGGNGSGKSTLIKVLAGVHRSDAGQLEIFGERLDLASYTSAEARDAGLRFVHQDLGLFGSLSVEENFGIDGGYPRRGPSIDWRTLRGRVTELLAENELDIDPRANVGSLRPSDRTMIAIARALQTRDADRRLILILDEPTARLAAHESEHLIERIRRRAKQGQTVLLVSHRLGEVLSVADSYTILRDGRVAARIDDHLPTEDELVEAMAGRAVAALRPTGTASHAEAQPLLELAGVVGGPLRGIDLTVHRGEILGLAGLVGSGRSTVLKTIFGVRPPAAGRMILDGTAFAPTSTGAAVQAGIALVPEDRAREAAFSDRSVSENLAVARLKEYFTGWMPRGREHRAAKALIERFGIKVASAGAPFSSMSGGNQQKVILARWLQREPRLILLDEPTQGVDVMSRADIYATIRGAAQQGAAVIVASSDMTELHALCDRVLIVAGGLITAEVFAGDLDADGLTSLVLRDRRPHDLSDPDPEPKDPDD